MNFFKILALSLFVVFFLTACEEKVPSDDLSARGVRPYAESNLLLGMEIIDYHRDNGWADPGSANQYVVKYTLNYRLTKPFAEVVLENAKNILKASAGGDGLVDAATRLGMGLELSQWISAQGKDFDVRRDAVISACPSCLAFWNAEDNEAEAHDRRQAFLYAMYKVESLGFKDDAKTGDKKPQWAQAVFLKTERGWTIPQ